MQNIIHVYLRCTHKMLHIIFLTFHFSPSAFTFGIYIEDKVYSLAKSHVHMVYAYMDAFMGTYICPLPWVP